MYPRLASNSPSSLYLGLWSVGFTGVPQAEEENLWDEVSFREGQSDLHSQFQDSQDYSQEEASKAFPVTCGVSDVEGDFTTKNRVVFNGWQIVRLWLVWWPQC